MLMVGGALSVNTFINYSISRSANTESVSSTLFSLATSHTAAVNQWITTKTTQINALTPHVTDADPTPLLLQTVTAGNFLNAYISYPDKSTIASDQASVPAGYDPTSSAWYKQAAQAKKLIITNPYIDAITDELVVTVAAPRFDNGHLVGIAAGDVNIVEVIDNVRAIHPTKDSFGMLMDANGTIIGHPDAALTLKSISTIAPQLDLPKLLHSGSPVLVDISGRPTFMIAMPVKNTSWFIVVAIDKAEATANMRSLLNSSIISLFLLMALAAAIVLVVTKRSIGPLIRVREAMKDAIAQKDLTHRLRADGKDEVGQIANEFNQFLDKLAVVMKSIRSSSESVHTGAEEIAAGNLELSSRTESAAASLQQTSAALEQISLDRGAVCQLITRSQLRGSLSRSGCATRRRIYTGGDSDYEHHRSCF